MQEVLIMRVIVQELVNDNNYNILVKIIAQEVLNKDEISVIAQEDQLSSLFKGRPMGQVKFTIRFNTFNTS